MTDLIFLICFGVSFTAVIAFALYRNKREQEKVIKYYKETNESGLKITEKSISNQEKIITLLEDISRKLDQ